MESERLKNKAQQVLLEMSPLPSHPPWIPDFMSLAIFGMVSEISLPVSGIQQTLPSSAINGNFNIKLIKVI